MAHTFDLRVRCRVRAGRLALRTQMSGNIGRYCTRARVCVVALHARARHKLPAPEPHLLVRPAIASFLPDTLGCYAGSPSSCFESFRSVYTGDAIPS